MKVRCCWEHNGEDTLLYALDYVGAYARGENLAAAAAKMPEDIASYLAWLGQEAPEDVTVEVAQEKASTLTIADNDGTILACRQRGFALLEQSADFLSLPPAEGSYGETWSLRKVLRRFVWHDRIHARAMYRMAMRTFGTCENPFRFTKENMALLRA